MAQWFRFKKKWPKFKKIEILIFGSIIYFFKTSKLGVSENLYKANALGYIILKKTGQSSPKNDLFLEVKTGLLHFYFKKNEKSKRFNFFFIS
jgi:hypothetical protein